MRGDGYVWTVLIFWLLSALFSVAVTVGLVWAAFHFILKFW